MRRDTASAFETTTIDVVVRRALASDQAAIVALVRSEPLNPNNLHWHRFVVANDAQGVIGAAQLRSNSDGSHELASLVVAPHARRHSVATRMIELLANGRLGRVFAVTRRANVQRFARWGFVPIAAREAPREARQRRLLGQFGGGLVSLLRGRWPAALVVLERVPPDRGTGQN